MKAMQGFQEIGKKYGATKFQGDVYPGQTFELIYDDIFASFRLKSSLKFLEIGIQEGASLRVWKEYFPYAQIIGIDNDVSSLFEEDRITTYLIDQSDEKALRELLGMYENFDIVVDDGGHISAQQIISLNVLLPYTKYVYCIEDLDTSYPEIFPKHSEEGRDTIMMELKKIVDSAVLERNDIERIDFRKRFCAIYKKNRE